MFSHNLKVANPKWAPPVRPPPSVPMSAVLSVVGSFELQLENEQKWLIYGPATRTHARARREQGKEENKPHEQQIHCSPPSPQPQEVSIGSNRSRGLMSCPILALSRCVVPLCFVHYAAKSSQVIVSLSMRNSTWPLCMWVMGIGRMMGRVTEPRDSAHL